MKRGPLTFPAFRWLLGARTISFLGNAIAPVALAFAVLDLTGSASDLGFVVAARSAANVALVLYGGVIADRLPRSVVLVGSSLAAGLTQGLVAVLMLTHSATIALLLVLAVINGAVSAISFPASKALTAQTVPVDLLQPANALLRLGINGSAIFGAAIAGILVSLIGSGWCIAVDAVTFVVAAGMFSRIRIEEDAPTARTSMLTELREGWGEFVSHTWVWVVVVQFLVVNAVLTGSLAVLGPAVADESFGRRAWGLLLACQALGLVVGGLLALRFRPGRPLFVGVLCSGLLAAPVLGLGLTSNVLTLIPLAFVAGIGSEVFGISWDLSLQEHIPPERLARVYAYDALGSFIAIPVGAAVIGPLAVQLGLEPALIGSAVVIITATALALLNPSVRSLRRLEMVTT